MDRDSAMLFIVQMRETNECMLVPSPDYLPFSIFAVTLLSPFVSSAQTGVALKAVLTAVAKKPLPQLGNLMPEILKQIVAILEEPEAAECVFSRLVRDVLVFCGC